MKALTAEWVQKAEGDFQIVESLARSRKRHIQDGLCFHAQQCAEKYLKARLYEADISFPPIHKLLPLLDLAITIEPLWESFRIDLAYLSNFAVAFRYPGESASRAQATQALRHCRKFRHAARSTLGLEKQTNLTAKRRRK